MKYLLLIYANEAAMQSASQKATGEASGGLAYDAGTNKWSGVGFSADEKFVLQLKFVESKTDSYGTFDAYNVSIKALGTSLPSICHPIFDMNQATVSVYSRGRIVCSADLQDYTFDLVRNRFVEVYTFGYLENAGTKDNPAVVGGTCTKIE